MDIMYGAIDSPSKVIPFMVTLAVIFLKLSASWFHCTHIIITLNVLVRFKTYF